MTLSVTPATLALGVLLGASACAPASPDEQYAAAGHGTAAPASYGVVVTVRPVPLAAQTRAARTGSAGLPRAEPGSPAAFEFILREDSGQTVSVVQPNEEGLRPGERAVLSMGARTRLSRAAN